ncbi:isoprenyl transferase [Aureliella helgolandensis]|uniref:Isoprenyl transferase n=1 Tax=Aureliella helgolandensis TaxID=2527968 RepID=A0A518G8Z5_9BACT|nr:isoprenyl transferase [Aureliella helgolandensis]QDV25039.1 Decaprenyl diphosphate synthase-like protein [Aureliella helgolandensis]
MEGMEAVELNVPLERRPKHVAVIMDGNGRWAQQQSLPRIEGHLRGVESVRAVMEACREFGVEVLTLYCLSSENWKRPALELEFLMTLLKEYLIAERESLVENNLRVKFIGQRDRLPLEVQEEMERTYQACASNDGMTLCLAINYGARLEMVDAIRQIAAEVQQGEMELSSITEDTVDRYLYTAGLPDPDLLIRTSGEMRISNFLLWQISYSEIYVTDTLWPEFGRSELALAIADYAGRNRRFGGLQGKSPLPNTHA